MSGTGTNADNLLAAWQLEEHSSWFPGVIVTDRPETSSASALADEYRLPLVSLDIAAFYRAHGLAKVTLATEEGMRVRELWTDALREKLAAFRIDFGVFAGFIPLTNLVEDFPCLNVHPGDLTLEDASGRRTLAGLHAIPVENAILLGRTELRSSVILVQPVSLGAKEMDAGFVLGVSAPLPLDLSDASRNELRECAARRAGLPRSSYKEDALALEANRWLERLKVHGDWVLLPQVVDDFAAGKFAAGDDGRLYYENQPVRTVEYDVDRAPRRIPHAE